MEKKNETRSFTFAMVKPSCVQPDILAKVEKKIHEAGLSIDIRCKKLFTLDDAKKFYAEHEGKDFFEGLVNMLTSSDVYCMKLSGVNAVEVWRKAIGPTNPNKGEVGQLRHDFANGNAYEKGSPDNGFHGSACDADAARECKLVFGY